MAELGPKKKKKKWIIPVVIVGVLAVLIYFGATAIRDSRRSAEEGQTRVATAQRGNIELTVAGTGSLVADDAVEVKIPSLLVIDEIQVEVGDVVKAGDVLATLDTTELQSSILEVREEIATIDEQISEAESNTEQSEIAASVAGRVKEIDVHEGDDVSQAMTQKGYLMVLSLDGKMKADIESTSQPAVDSDVTIVLPDGSEEEGTVVSSGPSAFSVTLTDNGPAVGQAVSVQNEDGQALGDGVLEINAPLNIVGSEGTVKSVNVEENEKVSKGESLLTLQGSVASQEYRELTQQRASYEELLRMLLTYAQTGAIVADMDGSVTEIQAVQTASSTEGSSQVDIGSILGNLPISAEAESGDAVASTLAYTPVDGGEEMTTLPGGQDGQVIYLADDIAAQQSALTAAAEPSPSPSPTVTELVGVVQVPIVAPALGGLPQTDIPAGIGYSGTITWDPAASFFAPETSYAAVVVLTADAGYRFADNIQVAVPGAAIEGLTVSPEAEQNTVSFRAVFPPTAALPEDINMEQYEQYIRDIIQNSIDEGISGASDALSGIGNIGGSISIDGSSLGGTSTSTAPSTSMQPAFTITAGKVYSIVAEIDEMDIFSIALGQDVKIVMDAMLDDVFTGSVEKISTVGTSQSNVTTYPVTIRMDETDTPLLAGMNATANIITQVDENVLLIPLDALQEEGEDRFVYLYDPAWKAGDDGQLGEIRYVTTGISDGVNVEILSGLEEGEEVIYTVTQSNAFLEAIMTMGGSQSSASSS